MKLSKNELCVLGFIVGWWIRGIPARKLSELMVISKELKPYIQELVNNKPKSLIVKNTIKWCKANINIRNKK